MKIQLTKSSQQELMNWHEGSGRVFLSDGTGKGYNSFDIRFVKNEIGDYILAMGNSSFIKLTPEQINKIGNFALNN
jgi:hypothetical protein